MDSCGVAQSELSTGKDWGLVTSRVLICLQCTYAYTLGPANP